jgi:hypothetical protein
MILDWDSLSCPILKYSSRLRFQTDLTQFHWHFYNLPEYRRLMPRAALFQSLRIVFFSLPAYRLGLSVYPNIPSLFIMHFCLEKP